MWTFEFIFKDDSPGTYHGMRLQFDEVNAQKHENHLSLEKLKIDFCVS